MSSRFGPYEHVVRMAGLFVIGIGAFVVLRVLFVPDDFGVYGHYRAGALDDNRKGPLAYAGRAACESCHPDIIETRKGGKHEAIGCEACHGPLAKHAAQEEGAPAPLKPKPREGCLACHTKDGSKPEAYPQVVASEHAPDGACTDCHNPHKPGLS
jgi:hypothetical protein